MPPPPRFHHQRQLQEPWIIPDNILLFYAQRPLKAEQEMDNRAVFHPSRYGGQLRPRLIKLDGHVCWQPVGCQVRRAKIGGGASNSTLSGAGLGSQPFAVSMQSAMLQQRWMNDSNTWLWGAVTATFHSPGLSNLLRKALMMLSLVRWKQRSTQHDFR